MSYPKFKACSAHVAPVFLDAAATVQKACGLIAEAARVGAKLIAFPESFVPGFPIWAGVQAPIHNHEFFKRLAAESIEVPGAEVQQLCAAAREHGLGVGVALKPNTSVEDVAEAAIGAGADLVLCMSIEPGYSGQKFMPEAFDRLRRLRDLLPQEMQLQVDGGVTYDNIGEAREAGANLLVAATAVFGEGDPAAGYLGLVEALP